LKKQKLKLDPFLRAGLDPMWRKKISLDLIHHPRQRRSNKKIDCKLKFARLVYLAYPTASHDIRESLAVGAFVRGVKDRDTEQALRLARCKTLHDALSYALEFEAVKQVSQGHAQVRQVRSRTPEHRNRYSSPGRSRTQSDWNRRLKTRPETLRKELMKMWSKGKGQNNRSEQTHPFSRSFECWNCEEKRHIRPQCPKPRRIESQER